MNFRAISIAAVLAAAIAAGCVPNDASIRIFALCFPPTPSDAGACTYPAACDTLLLGGLEYRSDVVSTDGRLIWPVQVDNQRTSNKDRSGGVETAIAWIEGYKISYSVTGLSVPDVDIGISRHPVNPGGSTVVIAPIIPEVLGNQLNGVFAAGNTAITAELKAYGSYGDGGTFETGPFRVQVTACKGAGCTGLVPFCPDPAKPVPVGSCPRPNQTSVTTCVAAAAP